jgi:hypothetical protein
MHVDDFIDGEYCKHKYARWVLNHFRLPAVLKNDFSEFMEPFKLFCDYEGRQYRCTGASRLGDIWLTSDFTRCTGYELRVDVAKCTNWSK